MADGNPPAGLFSQIRVCIIRSHELDEALASKVCHSP